MPAHLTRDQEIDVIKHLLLSTYGLNVDSYEPAFLAKTIGKRVAATGMDELDAYTQLLKVQRVEVEALVAALSVTYSEFFRNSLNFALLEQVVLPSIIEKKQEEPGSEIRIWSAGCAGGQEPWSVAMLLDELLAMRSVSTPFRIFATDISVPELEKAKSGAYSTYAVANVRLRHLEQFFYHEGDTYTISSRLKERVAFSHYDLLDGNTSTPPASIFGDFDLVLCSNVLLYYRLDMQYVILNKLRQGMLPSGYLVTDEAARRSVESAGGFRAIAPPAMIYRHAVKKV
ncbi:MAG: CheR family methyltransferase [Armatimonadota bacterium]